MLLQKKYIKTYERKRIQRCRLNSSRAITHEFFVNFTNRSNFIDFTLF